MRSGCVTQLENLYFVITNRVSVSKLILGYFNMSSMIWQLGLKLECVC